MTIAEFAATYRVTLSAKQADFNPHMSDWHGQSGATHWRCTLRRGERSMLVYFSQGAAYTSAPTIEDVLGCLALDASGYTSDFLEWCGNYGYDSDSRKAERTYKVVGRQVATLRRVLGDAFDALLECESM